MIQGFRVGQYTDVEHLTGCTVVLAPPEGAIGGAEVRGPAPATIGTESLNTGRLIELVHAVVLTGGSAFGLDSVAGVIRFLEERDIGYQIGEVRVPIVAGAVLFDLGVGSYKVRPTAENAYQACLEAGTQVIRGNVGAGTGATVGKFLGLENATKGGVGYAELALANGVTVSALVAVNSLGDVVDHMTGQIVGGARNEDGTWAESSKVVLARKNPMGFDLRNTTIGVVMTDAKLTVEQANLVAMMAHDGIARATRPSHTMFDGDTLFVLASGARGPADITVIGHAAAECVSFAIVNGVQAAETLGGIRAWDS